MQLSKQEVIAKSRDYWNPHKTTLWQNLGIDLVIGRRDGYYLYDMDGRQFLDCHINGGTYSFGHKNPELIEVLRQSLDEVDAGNHHFPSPDRALLAEKLALMTPGDLQYSVFSTSGSEAVDIAIKTARHATARRKIVSVEKCFHGHTGYALELGDARFVDMFLANADPDIYEQIPFNDLPALERVLANGDVAAFILETVPATFGFAMPAPGYLREVRRITEKYGVIYIADEVQTGLLRSGQMWCVDSYNVMPDILITAKGFGGGLYPIAATVIAEHCAGWLKKDGFGHVSTYGGSELGCRVALKVLEICARPPVQKNVNYIAKYLRTGLNELMRSHDNTFVGIRQNGLIMGLEFKETDGAIQVMRALFNHGVWAIFSSYDPSVLQFKPGILWNQQLCDDFLQRFAAALHEVEHTGGAQANNKTLKG